RADALRWEVDDAHDLTPDQLLRPVLLGDLRAGAALAERAQVDPELVRRLSGFRKRFDSQDGADAHVHTLEIAPADPTPAVWGPCGPLPAPALAEGREERARIVVLEDLRIRVSAVGHALGAELGQAHAMPPAAPLEPHHAVLGDRDEQRTLQRIV